MESWKATGGSRIRNGEIHARRGRQPESIDLLARVGAVGLVQTKNCSPFRLSWKKRPPPAGLGDRPGPAFNRWLGAGAERPLVDPIYGRQSAAEVPSHTAEGSWMTSVFLRRYILAVTRNPKGFDSQLAGPGLHILDLHRLLASRIEPGRSPGGCEHGQVCAIHVLRGRPGRRAPAPRLHLRLGRDRHRAHARFPIGNLPPLRCARFRM